VPPEIPDHLFADQGGIGHQLDLEQLAAFDGLLLQHPLAEAVDGEDGRAVDVAKGQAEALQG
jgi:hypothetical protein